MRQLFLPAVLPTTLTNRWRLRPLNWMDPSIRRMDCFYPNTLMSYYHWRASRMPDFATGGFRLGDSGGYSIATLGAIIDPRDVILWQLKNCDVGVILDNPPLSIAGFDREGESAASNWEASLRLTALNTERMLPIYLRALEQGSPFRLWGVVHGEDLDQLEQWHEKICEVYPFTEPGEGWAVKPFPSGHPPGVARCLRFLKSRSIRRAHFFQTAGIKAVATLFCLGPKAGLEFLSYDATTPITQGNNRSLVIPKADSLGWKSVIERSRDFGETPARDYMRHECRCASCRWLRKDLEECPDIDDEYFKYRMVFHNVLATVKVFDALWKASQQDPGALLREKLGKDYKATIRAFRGLAEKVA